jgi:hypothetical protein
MISDDIEDFEKMHYLEAAVRMQSDNASIEFINFLVAQTLVNFRFCIDHPLLPGLSGRRRLREVIKNLTLHPFHFGTIST